MAKIVGMVLVIILIGTAAYCQNFYKDGKMPMFTWLPTESAPEAYPVKVISGMLVLPNGDNIPVPDNRIARNGWGELGATMIVGNELKQVPYRLDVAWYSFAEDMFYSGSFDLPHDDMLRLFIAGAKSRLTGKPTPYKRIIVGFGPEGAVSVWMSAEREVREVATFTAAPAEFPWSIVTKNETVPRHDYAAKRLADFVGEKAARQLIVDGVPRGLSERYRKQYRTSIEMIGPRLPDYIWIKYLNGERQSYGFSETASDRTHYAIPKRIEVIWKNPSGEAFTALIDLDEREALAAYQTLSEGEPDRALRLQIEIGDLAPTVNVYLREAKRIVKFDKSHLDVSLR